MTTIVIDGLNEADFRRAIENRLREGRAEAAITRLRAQLARYAGPGGMLPERFLTVDTDDFVLSGWDALDEAVSKHDRPGRPVTALSIAFGWPGDEGPRPDAEGRLRPHLEISYFTDDAYPFSQSGRDDLLEGYSSFGCTWSGDCEATDTALSLEGIDDLHGALATLEAGLLESDEPDEDGIRAGSLGACLLSALLVKAVTERIAGGGLPRPLCVMAGSSDVYPYFDAPVAGMPEEARKEAAAQEDVVQVDQGVPAPRYSSLVVTGIPRAKKRAVLVLAESDDEAADRIASLRSLNHPAGQELETPGGAVLPASEPEPATAVAGNGPLLVKKVPREAWDFREMLGPPPVPPAAGPPSGELDDRPVPAPPSPANERPALPAFTTLEPELQQRLQRLLGGQARPVTEVLVPLRADQPPPCRSGEPGGIEGDPASSPDWTSANAIAQPVRQGRLAQLRAWFRGVVEAGLARFSR